MSEYNKKQFLYKVSYETKLDSGYKQYMKRLFLSLISRDDLSFLLVTIFGHAVVKADLDYIAGKSTRHHGCSEDCEHDGASHLPLRVSQGRLGARGEGESGQQPPCQAQKEGEQGEKQAVSSWGDKEEEDEEKARC